MAMLRITGVEAIEGAVQPRRGAADERRDRSRGERGEVGQQLGELGRVALRRGSLQERIRPGVARVLKGEGGGEDAVARPEQVGRGPDAQQ